MSDIDVETFEIVFIVATGIVILLLLFGCWWVRKED